MVNGPKHRRNLRDSTFLYLLITVKAIEFEEVCLSDMENLRTVGEHTDCR